MILFKNIYCIISLVNASNHTKFLSSTIRNAQLNLLLLYCNKYTQGLSYYPFAVNLDRCVRSCNTLNVLSNKVCVLSKTEDLNPSMFKVMTGIDDRKH